MKRTKVESKVEQRLVIGLITSSEFLSQVSQAIEPELIEASHIKLLMKWCLTYWSRYGRAPGKDIENIYHAWVERGKAKEEMVEAVSDLLEHMSNEYEKNEEQNVPYLVDSLQEFLTKKKLERTRDEIDLALAQGDVQQAEECVTSFSSIEIGLGRGVDILKDDVAWETAFGDLEKPLFQFGNRAADRWFGHAFTRDAFVAILAPEKRGKTWWCVELLMRSLMSRRKVALFEVGDMSQSQIMRRLGVRLSRRPMFRNQLGKIFIPESVYKEDGGDWALEKRTIECVQTANAKSTKKAIRKFTRHYGISPKRTYVQVSVHSNNSINVAGICSVLDRWEAQKRFIPDVIIIDYPDILCPEPNTNQYNVRDQINVTWKALRGLSQNRHCLVIAPTQADAASYNVEVLTMQNFSEDKRKFAHVTGMFGLNKPRQDEEQQIMKLNWLVRREEEIPSQMLKVGQCLPLGRAFCCATIWGEET